mmetsp:Transcript_1801/g.7883  ORF Transcript_1801/g.7883 Transcript_1801/m.7883 type:complete len:203 (-) Transcript_1801:2311-2919(-)
MDIPFRRHMPLEICEAITTTRSTSSMMSPTRGMEYAWMYARSRSCRKRWRSGLGGSSTESPLASAKLPYFSQKLLRGESALSAKALWNLLSAFRLRIFSLGGTLRSTSAARWPRLATHTAHKPRSRAGGASTCATRISQQPAYPSPSRGRSRPACKACTCVTRAACLRAAAQKRCRGMWKDWLERGSERQIHRLGELVSFKR